MGGIIGCGNIYHPNRNKLQSIFFLSWAKNFAVYSCFVLVNKFYSILFYTSPNQCNRYSYMRQYPVPCIIYLSFLISDIKYEGFVFTPFNMK